MLAATMRRSGFCTGSWLSSWVLAAVFLLPSAALADAAEVDQARALFNVGAQSYEKGDYDAALEAFEAAYRASPRPGILFSMAQAHRRQYAISHDPPHLAEAIRLYREYLSKVSVGERRGDAAQALVELEPLAASLGATGQARESGAPQAAASRTRIMVSSEAEGATVALDGGASHGSPLIADVTAGKHRIRVEAKGYAPDERDVTAVEGGLVAIDVPLREVRARLRFALPDDVEISVDRHLAGRTPMPAGLEVTAGRHVLWMAKAGYEPVRLAVSLERAEERTIRAKLVPTGRRVAAYVAFGASALAFVAGGVFTGLSVARNQAASDIYDHTSSRNLSTSELSDYDSARQDRDTWKTAAIATFSGAVAAAAGGAALLAFDRPESPPPELDDRPEPSSPTTRRLEVSGSLVPYIGSGVHPGAAVRIHGEF